MKKILSKILTSHFFESAGMGLATKIAIASFVSMLSIGNANAIVVSGVITGGDVLGTGNFINLSPVVNPLSVGNNNFQTHNLYAFDEDQNIHLSSPLDVDVGSGGAIAAGSTVASHYVFFDPINFISVIGQITFDSRILGVATSTGNLDDSDFLINNSVTYISTGLRGLEAGDFVTILSANVLQVNFTASTPGDYIRVFTEFSPGAPPSVVPVPAALPLFGTGLALMGYLGWRKKRKTS